MFLNMDSVVGSLKKNRYAHILPSDITLSVNEISDLESLKNSWNYLHLDKYMKNNDSYRRRSFGRFHVDLQEDKIISLPDTIFFQGLDINTYAGGISRDLPPMSDEVRKNPVVHKLIKNSLLAFIRYSGNTSKRWDVAVHQFRIESKPGLTGNPTPEGIHKDGHTFISMHLINRTNVVGGMSEIYDKNKNKISEITMKNLLESILLDDMEMYHAATEVLPQEESHAYRDIMVIDYKEMKN